MLVRIFSQQSLTQREMLEIYTADNLALCFIVILRSVPDSGTLCSGSTNYEPPMSHGVPFRAYRWDCHIFMFRHLTK